MPVLKTCRPCINKGSCERQRAILDALRGLAVSTVTHRCPDMTLPYRSGQAVWAEVNDAPHSEFEPYGDAGPTKDWFPGVFMGPSTASNTRGLVVIRSGAKGEQDSDLEFMPVRGRDFGDGAFAVCKVIWSRIKPRDGADEPICKHCGNPYRVTGCEYPATDCPVGARQQAAE